jgi:hypothetical protein
MEAVLAAAHCAHGHVASQELLLARATLVLRHERLLNTRRKDTLLEPLPGRRRARLAAADPCGEYAARQRRDPHRQDSRSWEPSGARLAAHGAFPVTLRSTGTFVDTSISVDTGCKHERE